MACLDIDIFAHAAAFDPAGDFEAFLKSVPAKWVVYLMCSAEGRPVQLLCVKDLRASLERRLGLVNAEDLLAGPSRKVNYREIVREVVWRRVDSAFEADVVYLEAARRVFPQTYRGMLGPRPAWFVHVNPETNYPRYVKTIDPTAGTGRYFGPIEDKHAAQKLVHHMESLFDLCRDYSILTQSPKAGPCPWKQMGKCVGPCDGTIDLEAYRQLVAHSADVLADPKNEIQQQARRMQRASMELHFEIAQKIKAHIEQLSMLGKGSWRHVRPLERLAFVSLQRGPRAGTAKVFLITSDGEIEEIAGLIAEPSAAGDLLQQILLVAHAQRDRRPDDIGAERLGILSHHLFLPKAKQGVFIPLDQIDEKTLVKVFRDLRNQKSPELTPGEGVTRELQAM
jgi:excinuclease UvrABC nuclease subunit